MAYSVQPVLMPNTVDNVQIVGLGGFPATFNCFLLSFWVCLGGLPRVFGFTNTVPWGAIDINSNAVSVGLRPAVSTPYFFNGTFNVAIGNHFSHVLVSVSPAANTVQVYVNDVAISLSTGGLVTPATGFNVTGPGAGWEVLASGSAAPGSGVGDLFAASTSSLFDLSNVANRRKFINSDLTPVDLGSNAASVLGTAPPIYLTVRPGSANPNDFATNNGTGGTWTISAPPLVFETTLGCVALSPPIEKTLTDAELFFSPTTGFVDFSAEANRRKFIAIGGTPQWMDRHGALPFSAAPPVYLTTLGPPLDFAGNNGDGGGFGPTGTVGGISGPGCTPYYLTEAAGPAANPAWRLTVSDDGGRTWSRLVKPRSSGAIGEYLTRLRWLKMGQSRERMVKLECTDPVRRNIIGVYIDSGQGMS